MIQSHSHSIPTIPSNAPSPNYHWHMSIGVKFLIYDPWGNLQTRAILSTCSQEELEDARQLSGKRVQNRGSRMEQEWQEGATTEHGLFLVPVSISPHYTLGLTSSGLLEHRWRKQRSGRMLVSLISEWTHTLGLALTDRPASSACKKLYSSEWQSVPDGNSSVALGSIHQGLDHPGWAFSYDMMASDVYWLYEVHSSGFGPSWWFFSCGVIITSDV